MYESNGRSNNGWNRSSPWHDGIAGTLHVQRGEGLYLIAGQQVRLNLR